MAMEILVSQPKIMPGMLGDYSWRDYQTDADWRAIFPEILHYAGASPSTHPLAADLCAGDGSWARILVEHGWVESNLTCIDRCKSPSPLVSAAKWMYCDLYNLGVALRSGEPIPAEVLKLKRHFDLVISFLGSIDEVEDTVCEFLVRPKGVIFNANSNLGRTVS